MGNMGASEEESDDQEVGSDQEKNLTSIASGQGLVSLNSDLFYDPADFYQALNNPLKVKKDNVNLQQKQNNNNDGDAMRARSSTFNDLIDDDDDGEDDEEDDEDESWRDSTRPNVE